MFLGQNITEYSKSYDPELLDPIPRSTGRDAISANGTLPKFYGFDIWNFYEVSWLGPKGKPEVRVAMLSVGADSEFLVESKSVKLYLNSFNSTVFESADNVQMAISRDVAKATNGDVQVAMYTLEQLQNTPLINFSSLCIDDLDIECSIYEHSSSLLQGAADVDNIATESIHSNLVKSNCLVTNQPDWASIEISYTGPKINHEKLLQYLVSFRNHNEFHEQCIEQIFSDITNYCSPTDLTVYGRYTRRGGIDINPLRSSKPYDISQTNILRHIRQ